MTRPEKNTKNSPHRQLTSVVSVICVSISVLIGVFSASTTRADQSTSTSFKIETGVIDTGGSRATGTGFGLQTSIGQPGTGISTSTSFILRGGFLNFPALVTAVATSAATTSQPSGGNSGVSALETLTPREIIRKCDFNNDNRCDIVDLSILLFHYSQTGSRIARYDLNLNERIDFPDVSVLMFYWTG